MPYGYWGKMLRINLTTGNIKEETFEESFMRKYFGGKGFVSYYLLKEVDAETDPLGPENKLIFATGVMTGVPVSGMCRYAVGGKSPLTGGYGQSEAGGWWGPELKMAGYDGIIIEGKAEKPVYIYIKNEEVQIKDATHLWGKNTDEAQRIIREENGDKRIRVAQIGPAGERQINYACIVNELKHANGRTGMGAVMGSKNLKAIAVRGTKKLEFKDKQKITEIAKWFSGYLMENPLTYGLYNWGTAGGVMGLSKGGILPTRNFKEGSFEGAEKIWGKTMAETILKKREGCYACAIRCKRVVEVKNDKYTVDPEFGGPEYETVAAFGSLCGIDDLEMISKANELCNKYTLDTISTGMVIAFAMECFEEGILTEEDTGGLKLNFGNAEAALKLVEMIAKKEGIGEILALGSQRAAEKIGKGAEKFALTVKNQELPMHEPRGKVGVGIGYAVSDTGADHMQAGHDSLFTQEGEVLDSIKPLGILKPIDPFDLTEKKVREFMYLQFLWSFYNMAGICDFSPVPRGSLPLDKLVEVMRAATGWNVSLWEMLKAGERGLNMSRLFNLRCGIDSKDDRLPERLYQPLEGGSLKGVKIDKDDFNKAIKKYYAMMGWDEETGIPRKEKLEELDIKF
ncbi:MAG: aldehyde:ferredoxin oxidoreductase [Thermosediminibacterales bacterium]|nr:aldehyde:ferredoxin oxidoreductase [Thermosediminibacterales bacterium]MDK2836381.1 aldehyde:ferredoxin oxidoreductase [Thermosediminibacterales bacterium]